MLIGYGQEGPAIVPLPLLNVQLTLEQFVWLAVNWNVFVPTAAVTVTPFVGLNPAGAPFARVPDIYVEFCAK